MKPLPFSHLQIQLALIRLIKFLEVLFLNSIVIIHVRHVISPLVTLTVSHVNKTRPIINHYILTLCIVCRFAQMESIRMQIINVNNAQYSAKLAQVQRYAFLVTNQISYFHNSIMVCVIQVVKLVFVKLTLTVNLATLQALLASISFL